MLNYGITKEVNITYEEAIAKTTEELAKEGFGILTQIDVKAKMKEKINEDMENYIILGACNPSLAFEAIQVEQEIGLFLPCNVIVYEKDGKVFVSAIKPTIAMGMIQNDELPRIAKEAETKLIKVINSL